MTDPCPFCAPDAARGVFTEPLVYALWDGYPVSPGHALVISTRHVATWFDASDDEHRAIDAALATARAVILDRFRDRPPDGWNIGINAGASAGQTVMHLHVHLIPRWTGDVENPRGGVRHVMPGKGNYDATQPPSAFATGPIDPADLLRDRTADDPQPIDPRRVPSAGGRRFVAAASSFERAPQAAPPHTRSLVTGEHDPLITHLAAHLSHAARADFAVAFIQQSGLALLEPHLEDLLSRPGARMRLVTGDYLDVTDPDALARLLDLAEAAPPDALTIRVFETGGILSFHPKAYVFHPTPRSDGAAFVGSSNLSRSALTTALEWNYRVISSRDEPGFQSIASAFDALFAHPATVPLTDDWIDHYRTRRAPLDLPEIRRPSVIPGPSEGCGPSQPSAHSRLAGSPLEPPEPPPEPTKVQREALSALESTRDAGYHAGLVVLATGLGKTWLAAFDSARDAFPRVLFIAHRDEILRQAMHTFRRIRPSAHLGLYTGRTRDTASDVLFASVQTLGRAEHLRRFAADAFDYIVVDEFHHAEARSYRRLLEHFAPRFLLGLTATPERTDGADLLALCQQNLVYRSDLAEGIEQRLLAPFHYFGIPDDIDYRNIPWRSGRFDETELTNALATRKRATNALDEWRAQAGPGHRTLAFCASIRHADFVRDVFREHGIRAAAVHSEPTGDPRTLSLEQLEAGDLDIVFAVDVFNEGVDVPSIDTVLMLRPTDSRVIYLQQLGRGLRLHPGKTHLTVIDYIGNHRSFLLKVRALLDLGEGTGAVRDALAAYEAKTLELPPGCAITYQLEALDILKDLASRGAGGRAQLEAFYESYRAEHGERPSAAQVLEAHYAPGASRASYGSWFRLVKKMGDLEEAESKVFERHGNFLATLETTPMTRSFKMVLLRALLAEDALPGEIAIDRLVRAFRRVAESSPRLRNDVGAPLDDEPALRRYLEKNPIDAWAGARGTGGQRHFAYDGTTFRSTLDLPDDLRPADRDMAAELIELRLAQYLDRTQPHPDRIVCKVSHTGGRPILFFEPGRNAQPGIPTGRVPVRIDGEPYEATFVKVAVNIIRARGSDLNALPEILQRWFGRDAGLPGTRNKVVFEREGDGYALRSDGQ